MASFIFFAPNVQKLSYKVYSVVSVCRKDQFARFLTTNSDKTRGKASIWKRYLAYTEANPLKTQASTTVVFAGLGNILAQTAIEKRSLFALDFPSFLKFTTFSLFYTFPVIRTWLWTLDRIVKPSTFAPLKKVALDQLCFSPVSLAAFLGLMQIVDGHGVEGAKRKIKTDWWPVLMNSYKLWPAAQLINFYMVPFNQRILFLSAVSLIWSTYLAAVIRQGAGGSSGSRS